MQQAKLDFRMRMRRPSQCHQISVAGEPMRENTPDAHIHYRPADHAQNTSITASPHVMRRLIAPLLGGLLLALSGLVAARSATDATTRVPPPALDEAEGSAATEIAVLAGGCFWG